MYGVHDYGGMIADTGRTQAYAESLKRYVTPGSIVVDLGAGTGVLALWAGRLGARKVYAIESGDALQLGRCVAERNGVDGRVEFIQGVSTRVQLPEKADVLVFDIHGVLPAYQRSLFSIIDARDRFLAIGGCLIPRRETLWAAIAEAATLHNDVVGVWGSDVLGTDMTVIRQTAANRWHKCRMQAPELVTTPACWAALDYAALSSPDVRGDAAWQIRDRRTAHGICAWFDWEGAEGVTFSNSPLSGERHIFGQAFFPWPEPLELHPGDEVRVALRADAVGSEYIYRWETLVQDRDGGTRAVFRQSDFLGQLFSPERLRRLSSTHVPALNEHGRIDRMILDGAASGLTLEQISRQVTASFPHRFAVWTDAQTRVGQVLSRYSE